MKLWFKDQQIMPVKCCTSLQKQNTENTVSVLCKYYAKQTNLILVEFYVNIMQNKNI